METLDRVIELQKQNKTDSEIMQKLQNEKISPSEINNALNQAKIKNAVSPPEPPMPQPPEPIVQPQETPMPQPPEPIVPTPQQDYYQPQQPQQDYYTPTPQAYSEQDYYAPQGSLGTETISEIAEQVATEILENYKSKTGDIISFKNQIQNQVNNIDDRLKRIENSIDKLQQAIIGKIGEFGESSAMIHKDLDNLHGTVAKLMNPLIDNVNEMKKINK